MEGVAAAASFNWVGGYYQDERNQFGLQATDPDRFFDVYPEYEIDEAQKADWIRDRGSLIIGESLVERFGWKVGDTVPLRSPFYQYSDGTNSLDFRIAGVFNATNGDNASAFFHWEYLNESIGTPNLIGFVGLRVEDPAQLSEVAKRIDDQFANSPAETKTDTESAFIQGYANQMGDIGAIVTAVVSAVFFTILLVSGNAMAQSVRERINELAVLKTLGYSGFSVVVMVMAEAFVITAIGGAIGLSFAALLSNWMSGLLQQFFPTMGMPSSTYIVSAVLVIILSVLAALLPSLQAGRLKITDALRRA
jgi:putative ABC transport system permease protein